ncbi:MAG: EAL domain-containing protein [Burkholderiales bacterium]|nr:EAL domain-containing protein [Burkholderiales bacterium]
MWKILIVDDEPGVHDVTRLVLQGQVLLDRPLLLLHTASATAAFDVLREHRDVAVILLDVVMETDRAGLDFVETLRGAWNLRDVRIIVRTGQPGQAPEGRVMLDYDINDYTEKTELTATKLLTTIVGGIRAYRDLQNLHGVRETLQRSVRASAALFTVRGIPALAATVLTQLAALGWLRDGAALGCGAAVDAAANDTTTLATWGKPSTDGATTSGADGYDAVACQARRQPGEWVQSDGIRALCLRSQYADELVVCLRPHRPLDTNDVQGLTLFLDNAASAFENACYEHRSSVLARLPGELPEPILRIGGDGTVLYANAASQTLLTHWRTKIGERLPEPWGDRMAELLVLDRRLDAEIAFGGRVFELSMNPVPAVGYLNLFGRDVTEYRQVLSQLQYRAFHDELTGLHNRAYFRTALDAAIARSQTEGTPVGVILIDLDQFKQVNDTIGHDAGDIVLKEVARRLSDRVRGDDVLARLGGDEFGVLVLAFQGPDELNGLANRLRAGLEEPITIESREWPLGCSLGVTSFPRDASTADGLMRCADLAMYHAKREGAGGVSGYDDEIQRSVRHRANVEVLLRQALKTGTLDVHYQPILHLDENRIIGVEALARMPLGKGEFIPPHEFIGIAEECGLIEPLGDWVLRRALADMKRWEALGHGDLRLAVNVSSRQLRDPSIASRFRRALVELEFPPARLEVELTESVLVSDVRSAVQHIWELHALGARLSIDDFGTGYSSLTYLRSLPVSKLKIDRSFVIDLARSRDALAIVDAVLSLGKSLRLEVIAEGVETPEQAQALRKMGCRYGQGYLFGRPVTAEDFEQYLGGVPRRSDAP